MTRNTLVLGLAAIVLISAMSMRYASADNSGGTVSYSSAFLAAHPACAKPRFSDNLNCEALAKLDISEAEMKQLYNKQYAHLHDKNAREYLGKTQERWIAFRDADCAYQKEMWVLLGAARNARYWDCQSADNRKRIEQLRDYAACDSDDCPQ